MLSEQSLHCKLPVYKINPYFLKAQDIDIDMAIGYYPVLPGPAIYPAADLDGLSRYLRAPTCARRTAAKTRRQPGN